MIARRDAQAGVAVDDARGFRCDGNVGEQARHQACSDGGAVHGGNDRLAAIDNVVDQVLRFAPDPSANVEIVRYFLHQIQIAAAGKTFAFAAQNRDFRFGIGIEGTPNFCKFVVHAMVGSGKFSRLAHDDFQDTAWMFLKFECGVSFVASHGVFRRNGQWQRRVEC